MGMKYPKEFKDRLFAEFPDKQEWLTEKFKWDSIDIGTFLEKHKSLLDPYDVLKMINEKPIGELIKCAEKAKRRNDLYHE